MGDHVRRPSDHRRKRRTGLGRHRARVVEHGQRPNPHRIDDRLAQRRTGQEHAPGAVRGELVGLASLGTRLVRRGSPLHARLSKTALAHQNRCATTPTADRCHRRVGKPVVGPNGHVADPAALAAARFASTSLVQCSLGRVVSISNSKRSTMSGSDVGRVGVELLVPAPELVDRAVLLDEQRVVDARLACARSRRPVRSPS